MVEYGGEGNTSFCLNAMEIPQLISALCSHMVRAYVDPYESLSVKDELVKQCKDTAFVELLGFDPVRMLTDWHIGPNEPLDEK